MAVAEDPSSLAVVERPPRLAAPGEYGARLRALLAVVPAAPPGVTLRWPTDLLHDLDGEVIGYLHRASHGDAVVDITVFADPVLRPAVAPAATWQHRLRATRNACAAVGALHIEGVGLGTARL